MHTYVESDHAQFAAMAEYQEKYGVKVKRWSDEDLAAFEKAWLEVLAEDRPRIRCSRRSPTTISTTARSSRCGARRRR